MIRHAPALFVVLLVGVFVFPPVHVEAHGTPLKGEEIDRSVSLSGQTGACECMQQWYTVGFRPGAATISGKLTACGDQGRPYCFMVVSLLRGNSTLRTASVQCSSKVSRCNRQWIIRYPVRSRGAYYLQVRGDIGLTMHYTLRPSGRIYRLHCGTYC